MPRSNSERRKGKERKGSSPVGCPIRVKDRFRGVVLLERDAAREPKARLGPLTLDARLIAELVGFRKGDIGEGRVESGGREGDLDRFALGVRNEDVVRMMPLGRSVQARDETGS